MRGIAAYKSVSLESSDQRELVVMCFEALIRRHKAAIDCFEKKEFINGVEHVRISREILCELLLGLDHDAAPDMTSNLASFTTTAFVVTKAGHETSGEHVRTSLGVVEELYGGFKSAFSDAG